MKLNFIYKNGVIKNPILKLATLEDLHIRSLLSNWHYFDATFIWDKIYSIGGVVLYFGE